MAGQLNIEEIKNSGLLELYVAGALSEEESERIHGMVKNHAALQEEVSQIEEALMQVASSYVDRQPQVNTMYQVLNKIEEEKIKESGGESKIVEFLEKKEKTDLRWLQVAAAIALILSFIGNLLLYSRLSETQTEFVALQENYEEVQRTNQQLQRASEKQADFIALTTLSSANRVSLEPIAGDPKNQASVIYDEDTQSIGMSQWALAELSEKEVYQLWAIYGEEVVSLGVLPKEPGAFYFNFVNTKPDAFAISLEPDGESETPTDVIMVGNV